MVTIAEIGVLFYNTPMASTMRLPGRRLHGYVRVEDARTGRGVGYLAKHPLPGGQLGIAHAPRDRLRVTVSRGASQSMRALTSRDPRTKYVGAIEGYAPQTFSGYLHYFYLGATALTEADRPPEIGDNSISLDPAVGAGARRIESALWTLGDDLRLEPRCSVHQVLGERTRAALVFRADEAAVVLMSNVNINRKTFGPLPEVRFRLARTWGARTVGLLAAGMAVGAGAAGLVSRLSRQQGGRGLSAP
ncbi:hypothetical protein BH09ACT5_BH09ACT5_08430 [soil metagenome]